MLLERRNKTLEFEELKTSPCNGLIIYAVRIQPGIKYGWYKNARRKKKIPGPSFGI